MKLLYVTSFIQSRGTWFLCIKMTALVPLFFLQLLVLNIWINWLHIVTTFFCALGCKWVGGSSGMFLFLCHGLTVHILFALAFVVAFDDAVGFWHIALMHVKYFVWVVPCLHWLLFSQFPFCFTSLEPAPTLFQMILWLEGETEWFAVTVVVWCLPPLVMACSFPPLAMACSFELLKVGLTCQPGWLVCYLIVCQSFLVS